MKELTERTWDVIVVGTGIGGGTIGRALSEAGLSVLFLEKGRKGFKAEQQTLSYDLSDPTAREVRGYWPKPFQAMVNGTPLEFFGPLGSGVGGSSSFYAAAFEQPERHDLEDVNDLPHPTGGWPVSYDEFRPYFTKARDYYSVLGQQNPLSNEDIVLNPPPEATAVERQLISSLQGIGLHPYRGHAALKAVENCKNCFGSKCPYNCKQEGRSAGVEPALQTGRAVLIDRCEVTKINGNANKVSELEARRHGETLNFKAHRYVLSAGALRSPHLLLRSASETWPSGCANESDLVGRNLMFHLNEIFAIWLPEHTEETTKSITLRDYYSFDSEHYGLVQALGYTASYGELVHYLNQMYDRSFLRSVRALRQLTRIPAAVLIKILGSAQVFVGSLEDYPDPENRVLLTSDADAIRFQYNFSSELLNRRKKFRRRISKGMRALRPIFLNLQPEPNYGHSNGTLCFGDDPAKSVLNRNCQAHGVKNLYVADASFMPTSTGVNPSLLIASNALRVADSILEDFGVTAYD